MADRWPSDRPLSPARMQQVKPLRTAATLLVLSKLPKPGLLSSKPAVSFRASFSRRVLTCPCAQYDYRILLVHRSQKSAFMVSH